jgi:hypothetical protein
MAGDIGGSRKRQLNYLKKVQMKDDKLWDKDKAWAQVLGDGKMRCPYVKCA